MYGLMRAGICSRHQEQAYQRRLHYCGTCKTMGRLYGQGSRLLLNNDAVFLGELLTALTPEKLDFRDWGRSYQSFNCLSLPNGSESMPLALQVAATATLVMSEFKVADQLQDGGRGRWKLAQRIYSQSFYEAAQRLKAWDFPLDRMWEIYRTQKPRESAAEEETDVRGVIGTLEHVAEPTAAVTGWTFQHGANVVGASAETQLTMYALGFAFGKLVYVLDAWDDFEKDNRTGDFNALRAAFGLRAGPRQDTRETGIRLPESSRVTTQAIFERLCEEVSAAIEALPLPAGHAKLFADRLRANLARRLRQDIDEPTPRLSPLKRLSRAYDHLRRVIVFRPAYAVEGGAGRLPLHETRGSAPEDGIPTSSSPPRRVRRAAGCGDGGCECCGCECCGYICCDGLSECCVYASCEAVCSVCGEGACAGCCEGACGGCGACCG